MSRDSSEWTQILAVVLKDERGTKLTELSLHEMGILRVGKCTPWYVYVLKPSMRSERPCMRKLAALTQ